MVKENAAFIFQGGSLLFFRGELPDAQQAAALPLVDFGSFGSLEPRGCSWGRVARDAVLPEGWEDVEAVDICYVDPSGNEEPALEAVLPTPGGRFAFAPQTRCAYIVRPHK